MKGKALWSCRAMGVVLALLLATAACGHPAREHIRDWNELFGARDETSQKNLAPLWEKAQKVIDQWQNVYNIQRNVDSKDADAHGRIPRIKEECPWFTWGNYGHRLLFHWGFNGDPKTYGPLQQQIKIALEKDIAAKGLRGEEAGRYREREKKKLEQLLIRHQRKRNSQLIKDVEKWMDIPKTRGYAGAVATIIHDVHLLGDYETPLISALPPPDAIERDLIDHGFQRLLRGGDRTERLQKIDADLKEALKNGRGRTYRKRAELLLEKLKYCIPQILNERFKETLKARGITLVEPEEGTEQSD